MKLPAKTFLVLLVKAGCAQLPVDQNARKVDYGFTTSTFAGTTLNNFVKDNEAESKSTIPIGVPTHAFNYGWKQGLFLWLNLNSCFAYKPEVNAVFSVVHHKNLFSEKEKTFFSTSFGFEFKPQLIIRLGCWNSDPVIKLARNMSYYLTGKQAYLIIGPKFSYHKPDRAFLKCFTYNTSTVGLVFGAGIDNLFPNLEVAPEFLLSVEYKTQNYPGDSDMAGRYYTSLSVALNFF